MWQAVQALADLRPTAAVDAGSCTRRHGSDCDRCRAACPVVAVSLGEFTATVDVDTCIGCGLCVPACPVQAISGVGAEPADVARQAAGGTVRCDVARALGHRPDGEWTDVPCVAAVHSDTLTAAVLSSMGERSETKGIELLAGNCAECPVGMGEAVDRLCADVDATLAASGIPAQLSRREVAEPAPVKRGLLRRGQPEVARRPAAQMSRRSLFGLGDSGDSTVAQGPETPAGQGSSGERRSPRAVLLAAWPHVALPSVVAADGCTACEGCVRICPTGALSLHRMGPSQSLAVDPRTCAACGECVRACPEDVLSLTGPDTDTRPRVIARVGERRCSRCRRRLGPGDEELCHPCATRQSLADDVLRQLGL